jgi:hypothetical protein
METPGASFTCHSCSKRVERKHEEPPCEVLQGWLSVSCWKGKGEVKHYSFCSFRCLKSWVDSELPGIPDVFIKSFNDDED